MNGRATPPLRPVEAAVDPAREFDRLRALHETGLLDAEPSPELARISEHARRRFGVAAALVTLVDRDRLVVLPERGTAPRGDAFCEWTIRADGVFVIPDLTLDPRFADNPLVAGPPHHRFYAGGALTYLDGIRLGALCLLDSRPRVFSLGDRAELQALAEDVVALIASGEFAPPTRLAARRPRAAC